MNNSFLVANFRIGFISKIKTECFNNSVLKIISLQIYIFLIFRNM